MLRSSEVKRHPLLSVFYEAFGKSMDVVHRARYTSISDSCSEIIQ